MPLTEKARQRLAQLGYTADADLQYWHDLWQREGESFFWGFLRKTEEAAAEYVRWFPKLQAFSAECRQRITVPATESFSAAEREQYQILLAKMEKFTASREWQSIFERRPQAASMITTTRVGLAAAQRVFSGSGAIILLPEENQRWFSKVYHANENAFWWYALAWWTLTEGLEGEDQEFITQNYPIPEGNSYWIVVSGCSWGGLAGGANHEVWRWDGLRAEFIETYCVDTF